MGHNPLPPPVIRSRADRALAMARSAYVAGEIDVERYEEVAHAVIIEGDDRVPDLRPLPPRDPVKRSTR